MALQKQNLNINFSQGLDTKTDPFQVTPGKFLSLKNTIFTKGGLLQKRNGFGSLTTLPDDTSTFVTTFNGNLTAIGESLQAYSQGSKTWVNKGTIYPLELETLPIIRTNTNQTQTDAVVAPNGLICTAYSDNNGSSTSYKYTIADSTTGQNIIAPTVIPAASGTISGSPRVFLLGKYFVIVFTNVISATNHLQYIAINSINPTSVVANTDVSTQYTPASTVAFDGVVANNNLYLVWNGSDIGGAIRMTYIDQTLTQHNTITYAGEVGTIVSVCADTTESTPSIWGSYYDASGSDGYSFCVDQQLNEILAPTQIISSGTILNLASAAQNSVLTAFYEVDNNYSYDSGIPTHLISKKTVTQAGVVSSAEVVSRSVGLASKAFIINEIIYVLSAYSSSYQPTYFLIDEDGNVVSKLAYSNGGGYLTKGLPNVTVTDNVAQTTYLIKDLIQASNKDQDADSNTGIYSQTGINLASFTIGTSNITTAEIGNNLHLSGGFLWMYDGYTPVEHLFHLWPDSIAAIGSSTTGQLTAQEYFYQVTYEWTDNQGNIFRSAPSVPVSYTIATAPANFTGNRTSGSATLTSVSSFTGLQVGQPISGTGIPANTYILSLNPGASTLTMSANASSGSATSTTVTPTTLTSLTINVPTLRLTYKTANPVKIVIYRWSTAQQNYYQVTSISSPTLNNTTTDSIAFVDTLADSSIIGNNLIYTTGGVVENIAAPACSTMALFQSRLFLVDAEDPNLLWYSKQVIEGTPVETSDLFTLYIAPTTAAQGSTGPVTALAAMDDKLIIFKKNAIYYITGHGPDNTGLNSQFSEPIFITSTVGCSNPSSIVLMRDGLMFQSDKGIWLLDRGLSTSYIGAPVEDFNSDIIQSAVSVPGTNQVRFTLNSGFTLMYDYFWQQWGEFANIPAISSTLYENLHTYINSSGQVFQETPNAYLDGSNPVLMSFVTSWFNLAGLQGFERAYFFYLIGSYITPHRLTVQIAHDYNPSPSQTSIISPDNYSGPYGSDTLYGGSEFYGGSPTLEQWRIFLKKQKCQAFQITVSESYDATIGVPAGAGLTLSGLNLVVGMKKGYTTIPASKSSG